MTTSVEPLPAPTGQPTLDAIIDYLAELLGTLDPALASTISAVLAALGTVSAVLNPAQGREVERETELAALFKAKDVAGLLTYYDDVPAHPNKSRAICKNYLAILGQVVP